MSASPSGLRPQRSEGRKARRQPPRTQGPARLAWLSPSPQILKPSRSQQCLRTHHFVRFLLLLLLFPCGVLGRCRSSLWDGMGWEGKALLFAFVSCRNGDVPTDDAKPCLFGPVSHFDGRARAPDGGPVGTCSLLTAPLCLCSPTENSPDVLCL